MTREIGWRLWCGWWSLVIGRWWQMIYRNGAGVLMLDGLCFSSRTWVVLSVDEERQVRLLFINKRTGLVGWLDLGGLFVVYKNIKYWIFCLTIIISSVVCRLLLILLLLFIILLNGVHWPTDGRHTRIATTGKWRTCVSDVLMMVVVVGRGREEQRVRGVDNVVGGMVECTYRQLINSI